MSSLVFWPRGCRHRPARARRLGIGRFRRLRLLHAGRNERGERHSRSARSERYPMRRRSVGDPTWAPAGDDPVALARHQRVRVDRDGGRPRGLSRLPAGRGAPRQRPTGQTAGLLSDLAAVSSPRRGESAPRAATAAARRNRRLDPRDRGVARHVDGQAEGPGPAGRERDERSRTTGGAPSICSRRGAAARGRAWPSSAIPPATTICRTGPCQACAAGFTANFRSSSAERCGFGRTNIRSRAMHNGSRRFATRSPSPSSSSLS